MRFFILLLAVALTACALPVVGADNAKYFVCKYVTTPEGAEVLQSGQNPISVSASAIPLQPVVIGASFADAQGRSLVIAEDIGQPEPGPECPLTPPSPTPSPSASPSPSPSPSSSPSASPTPAPTPVAAQFSVETCPLDPTAGPPSMGMTALVPPGMSSIRFEHPILLLAILNVRIDGQLVTLDSLGDVIVTPGVHDWSISNPADTEVLAAGSIDCPVCNPAPLPTPVPLPPDETPLPAPSSSPGLPDTAADG